jgi:hypothetical protein
MACADDARAKAKATAISLIISFLPLKKSAATCADAAELRLRLLNGG